MASAVADGYSDEGGGGLFPPFPFCTLITLAVVCSTTCCVCSVASIPPRPSVPPPKTIDPIDCIHGGGVMPEVTYQIMQNEKRQKPPSTMIDTGFQLDMYFVMGMLNIGNPFYCSNQRIFIVYKTIPDNWLAVMTAPLLGVTVTTSPFGRNSFCSCAVPFDCT